MISIYKLRARQRPMHVARWVCTLLFVFFYSLYAEAQPGTIQVSGRVVDETGAQISGASVRATDGSANTSTDNEGRFSIRVAANGTLVFGYLGYSQQEVTVGTTDQQLTVTLLAAESALEEVVVVGYGTQRREAVTGSVASIGGDVLREVQSANFSQALQGRLPGVELTQTSSQPGGTMQIRIRGSRSLTASNDPLIVLDGIPFVGSMNDINPNDIKSLDILKDASATAIYGSRGANGVILITTNKGQQGQQARVAYNSFTGVKEVFGKFPMMSGPEMVRLRQLNIPYTSYGLDEAEDVNTDWQDLLYRTATMTSHDVTISSGTERGSYNFGGGYLLDQSVLPTQQFSRYALRGSVDQGVGDHFRFGFTTNNSYSLNEGNQVNVGGILRTSPLANPYNEDGSWKRTVRASIDEPWIYSREIIEDLRDQWLSETRAFASFNSLYGEVSIPWVEGLKYRVNVGLDYRQSNGGEFTGQGVGATNPTNPSAASVSNQHTYHWLVENLLTYDRTFADKHNVSFVGLYSAEQNKFNRSRMAARDIPAEQFQFYNLGHALGEITVAPGDQWYEVWGLESYMGRIMYSYDDRYMLTTTLRSDGSSRLAPGYKWHTYPAISAGWNIAQESFMKGIDQINVLKLRVGWGQTSNQSVATYATLGSLSTRPYNFGSEYAVGYFVNQLPSAHLGWEFSNTTNIGLDFSLLNHRLSGSVEYYITNTEDLLLSKGLPATSGVSSITENVGRTRNKGVELALNGTILDNRNGWTWEAGFNLYANRNLLLSLASGMDRNTNNWWFVGHPIDVIYDFNRIGLWQEGESHRDVLEPGGNAGMIKVEYFGDYDENGVPTRPIHEDYDRVPIDIQPNFQGGFNTRLAYKGFDLSVVGLFKSGGMLNSTIHGSGGYLNLLNGRNGNMAVDYWTPENTGAKYPNPEGIRSSDNLKYMSTMGYFDASFLKMRTLTLGYDFSRLRSSGVNLRMYVTAQNPFVMFSPYHRESGMDPETNSFGDENAAVNLSQSLRRISTIGTNTPATRNFLVGVNLTF